MSHVHAPVHAENFEVASSRTIPRRKPKASRRLIASAIEALESRRLLATINVTATTDNISANDGSVTLREAIKAMHSGDDLGDPDITAQNPGTFGTNDTIGFAIGGSGPHTIAVTGGTLSLSVPVKIDGYTQSGAVAATATSPATLDIVLDGTNAGASAYGIGIFDDGGCVIRGLVIQNFGGDGIVVEGSGSTIFNNVIAGNYIGTNYTGTSGQGNGNNGVQLYGAKNTTVGGTTPADRNIISGNDNVGVAIGDGCDDNTIQGNYIGTSVGGNFAVKNAKDGVVVGGNGENNSVIGNLISGNGANGILITADKTLVKGNLIGTDVTGATGLFGNTKAGVEIDLAEGNLIGGTDAGAGNLISGNGTQGILISGGASYNTVQGNYIGTNASGMSAIANKSEGVIVAGNNNLVGGSVAGARNIISGNKGDGVSIGFEYIGDTVQGNYIGTDATGTGALGNVKSGVIVQESSDIAIGGTVPQAGNVIAFNGSNGVTLRSGSDHVLIRFNSIYSNTGIGIDLHGDGVTPNDAGDVDSNPNDVDNHGQNFPVLASATSNGTSTTVSGGLNSTANKQFLIDFYVNDAGAPADTEAKTYLGTQMVTTDPSGNASFTSTFSTSVAPGKLITATATTTIYAPNDETSEISSPVQVTNPAPPPPVISISDFSANEGNTGITPAFTFTVTRTGDTSGTSDLYYQTVASSATAPSDYTAIALTPLHFNANEPSKQITVLVKGDNTIETDEIFYVKLSSPTGATISDDTGDGTIVNDDFPPGPSAVGYTNLKASKGKNNRYTFDGVVASFTSTTFNSASSFSASINWGDGQTSAGSIAWNNKTKRWDVRGLHQYVNRGTYNLVITITDANGRTATANSRLVA